MTESNDDRLIKFSEAQLALTVQAEAYEFAAAQLVGEATAKSISVLANLFILSAVGKYVDEFGEQDANV